MVVDKVLILASAIIWNKKQKILLLQRGETKTFQGYWQVPEGKLEEGESPIQALKREMQEELEIEIDEPELVLVTQSELEAKGMKYLAIRLIFKVSSKTTEITLSHEHSAYKWLNPEEIKTLNLLPGTLEAIESAT